MGSGRLSKLRRCFKRGKENRLKKPVMWADGGGGEEREGGDGGGNDGGESWEGAQDGGEARTQRNNEERKEKHIK